MEDQVQNTQQTAPAPMSTPTPPTMSPEKASTSGVVGTVIIIALIILGGLYFWGKRINTQKEANALINQEMQASQEAAVIEAVSTNDDTASLEAELNATQTSDLGAELQ
jgi:uncharacterized protein HemX